MEWLTIALAVLSGALCIWIVRLRRRSIQAPVPPPPRTETFSPLFYAAAAAFDGGLVLIDADRRVHYLNPQAEELLNLRRAVGVGQGFITLVRDYQVDSMIGDALAANEAREMVFQPLGGRRMLRLRAVPLREELDGALLLIRDVTQLSMLERARRDLVANVSHELRTPLASLKLLVETLQSEPPKPVAVRMLGQMAQEVDAITQLVDELHELSQIESGRVALQLAPTMLAEVVSRSLERIRPQIERKGLQLSAEISADLPLVLIDANRIGQVLINLLHNALKFTPEGGRIVVSAALTNIADGAPPGVPPAHPTGQWLLVSVMDSGIGIPPGDLARIFERFYKVDRARTRNTGGTGLGLAIAKHLVEGHGGQIWATSDEGQGSTFYLTLPPA